MGNYFSRVGSDPYYAGYERSLEALTTTISKFEDKVAVRQKNVAAVDSTIFMYGLAGFAIAAGVAAWALQQPPGVLSQRQHFMSVLPLFVEPIAAYCLYVLWNTVHSLLGRRDKAKLVATEARLRKMITDLKDTTHFQKTQDILSKYDPDYVAPSPPQLPKPEPRTPGAPLPFRSLRSAEVSASKMDTPRRQSALLRMTGAGASILPTLDKIASSLIGDNPALMQMLREAKAEAEALRERLALVEARSAHLASENMALRERLGEPAGPGEAVQPVPEPAAAASTPQPMLSRLSLARTRTADSDDDEQATSPLFDRQKSASAPVTPLSRVTNFNPLYGGGARPEGSEVADAGDPDGDFTFVRHDTPAVQQGAASAAAPAEAS